MPRLYYNYVLSWESCIIIACGTARHCKSSLIRTPRGGHLTSNNWKFKLVMKVDHNSSTLQLGSSRACQHFDARKSPRLQPAFCSRSWQSALFAPTNVCSGKPSLCLLQNYRRDGLSEALYPSTTSGRIATLCIVLVLVVSGSERYCTFDVRYDALCCQRTIHTHFFINIIRKASSKMSTVWYN